MDGNENEWEFGQMTAVLLLSSVILTLRDLYAGGASLSSYDNDVLEIVR